jgi:tetratricopeptide (TPR) repeat protein
MPIEGSLREFELGDIFQLLHLARKTGELKVVREPTGLRGTVIFSGGAVVGADVDEGAPRLGYMLFNAGKITEAELQRADRLHSEDPGRSWPLIFESLEAVDGQDLERYVKFHVEESIYEMLGWRDGRFAFGERPLRDTDSVTWLPVESLLMEGARRADELSALASAIDSPSAVPRLSERAAAESGILDLAPEEWEVVGRVDGASDVKSIAWTLGRSEFEIAKVVSKLADQGLLDIEAHDEPRAKPAQGSEMDLLEQEIERDELDSARSRVDSILEAEPDQPRAHFLAGRIRERSGQLERAAEDYEAALRLEPQAGDARQRLGLVRLKQGDLDGASREWTAYLRSAPDSGERRRLERAMTALRELQIVLGEFDGWKHP